jgi:uncharacterized protein (TIGR03067 family)
MYAANLLLISSVLLATEPAAPAPEPMIQGDLARLQGTWTTQAGPKHAFPVAVEIRGCSVTVTVTPPVGPKIEAVGEIQVDESASPKRLDWVRFTTIDGEQPFPEIAAIYELDGDVLRICNGGPNNPRPSDFTPGDGVLADVLTFRR